MAAISLQIGHQQARGARSDDGRRVRDSVDPAQQLAFERLALRGILLDEFRFGNGGLGFRVKAQAVLRDCFRDRSGAPTRTSAGQAAATKRRRKSSACVAGSLAATVSPRDKKTATQLAPMVPVPITAMWRISLLVTPSPPQYRTDPRRAASTRLGAFARLGLGSAAAIIV
jgi:hypothetical protein